METIDQSIPAVDTTPVQQTIFKGDAAQIFREALDEVKRAKKKHPHWPVHIVARAGIVCEEAGELIRAALNHKYESNSPESDEQWKKEMEKEALHVIATGIRFIESLRK